MRKIPRVVVVVVVDSTQFKQSRGAVEPLPQPVEWEVAAGV